MLIKCFLSFIHLSPDDGSSRIFRNVGTLVPDSAASHVFVVSAVRTSIPRIPLYVGLCASVVRHVHMDGAELFKKFLVVEERVCRRHMYKARNNAVREVSPLDFFNPYRTNVENRVSS